MKKIALLALLSFGLFSCKNEKKEESLKEKIHFEKPEPQVTDTTVGEFKITIKQLPQETYIEQRFADSNIVHVYLYSDYKMQLQVSKNAEILLDTNFVKESFGLKKDFLNKAVYHMLWVNGFNEKTKEISFRSVINVPDTDFNYTFDLFFNPENHKTKLVKVEDEEDI